MLVNILTGSRRAIISKLQNDNKQLDIQILAIINERNRIRTQYEEDIKKLRTIQEHLDHIEKEIKYFPKDVAK
ncbi:hypothetical protein NOM01_05765 [Sporolactobacillus sp. STSJ-5]|uniref:hypothetical protein n=1 Tax=Sporolactobacillus sp. STSJ-5 TaxID=2965076 RepID=UPI002107A1A8|nr:hypothetical protein [Sporolactobacillus sp. STSJ-5]MCQ2009505.1 hypothetical protein [Sporolactobacillus sp. STSJ-5]